jgi:xanthine dehydrogenase accessory factor
MLLKEHAAVPLGTVGGGCVEADVQEEARRILAAGSRSVIRRFTLTEDDIESGMLCGGSIDILLEIVLMEHCDVYEALLSRRERGDDSAIVTVIGHGQEVLGKFLLSSSLQVSADSNEEMQSLCQIVGEIPATLDGTLRSAIERQTVARLAFAGGEMVLEPVVGLQDLVIFGGGHVSRYLSRSAVIAGFRVTIIDDRPEFANPQRFPEAHRTLAVGFDGAWEQLHIMASTSIVIVTRGHKFDERVLERAVRTSARYIGMIGSKRKVITTFENLVRRGVPVELLQKVRAPMGLAIGALTAEEIAISITAELIAVRRGIESPGTPMSDRVREFFESNAARPPGASHNKSRHAD